MLSRNWFRAAILLCVAHSLVAAAAVFPDSTKSPLPEKRTALLTAFSDGLDSYFFNPADPDFYRSRQAELKAKFVAKGYAVTAMIPTRPNEPEPPASHPGYYTIPDFESELRGGKYGVLATDGHAGNIGIAVEHFLNDADVQTRLQDLRDAGYPAGEVESFIFGAEEKVIAISKVFIVNRAQLAQNALVWVYGCNTFRWFNRNTANPLNPATADIVFLDPAIGGVFFVGTNASCGADPQTRLNFFGRMLGDTPLGGVKKNWTVKEAFDQAASENGQLLARARSGDTSVYRLRLRNEPRRLKTTITQSPVYDYSYADQAYPFVDGDYPGDLSSAVKGFGHTGPMNVVIQFSEPMDSSWSGFKAQLVPQSGGTPIDFTGSWSTTLFPNDTWTGNLTVPADGSFPDGQMNVAITARDAYNDDDSSQSPDGEMDTTGDGLAHGKDTLVSFNVESFNIGLIADSNLFADSFDVFQFYNWDPLDKPTLGTNVTITAQDLIKGTTDQYGGGSISNLEIYKGNLDDNILLASNDVEHLDHYRYTKDDPGLGILAQLPLGVITILAVDLEGNEASARILVTSMTMEVSDQDQNLIDPMEVTKSTTIYVSGLPGTSTITLTGPSNFEPVTFSTAEPPVAEFDDVDSGDYVASALDANGLLLSSQTFRVDRGPPIVTAESLAGDPILDRALTKETSIRIKISDALSGPGTILVQGFDPVLFSSGTIFTPVEVTSDTVVFEDLDDGFYEVLAFDGVGNSSTMTFTVDAGPVLDIPGLYEQKRGLSEPSVPPSLLSGLFLGGANQCGLHFQYPMDFSASSSAGLKSITVSGPGTPQICITYVDGVPVQTPVDPANLSTGTVIDGFLEGGVPGHYTVTLTRNGGGQTQAVFDSLTMGATFDPDHTFANLDSDGVYRTGQLLVIPAASAGISRFTASSYNTGVLFFDSPSGGAVPLGPDQLGSPVRTEASDTRGNFYNFTMFMSTFGTVDPFTSGVDVMTGAPRGPTSPPPPWTQSFTTPVFDVYDSSALPGGRLTVGPGAGVNPAILTGDVIHLVDNADAAIAFSTIVVGQLTAKINGATLYQGNVYYSTMGVVSMDPPGAASVAIARHWSLEIDIKNLATGVIPVNHCQQVDPQNLSHCLQGTILGASASPGGAVIRAMAFSIFQGGNVFTPIPVGYFNATVDVGMGITLSRLNSPNLGTVDVTGGSASPDPGYRAVPAGSAVEIEPNINSGFPDGVSSITVSMPFDGTGLTAAQTRELRLVRVDHNGLLSQDIPFTIAAGQVQFDTFVGGRFMMLTTAFPNPVKATSGNLTVLYDQSLGVTVTARQGNAGQEPLKSLLASALEQGRAPIGVVTELLPEHTTMNPQGIVRLTYDPQQGAQQGLLQLPPQPVELSSGSKSLAILPQVFTQYLASQISSRLPGIHSFYGVFGSTTPRSVDVTPPVTTVSFSTPTVTNSSGTLLITTTTFVSFQATDSGGRAQASGVATTYVLVDQVFVNFQSTPPSVYAAPFTLALGTHTLAFFSVDRANNQEAPKSAAATVVTELPSITPPPPPPPPPLGTNTPANVTIVDVASTTVALSWDANGNPDGVAYTVFYGTIADAGVCVSGGGLTASFPRVTTTSISGAGLLAGTTYQFEVCAVGGGGLCDSGIQVVTAPPGQGSLDQFTMFSCGGGGGPGGGNNNERGLAITADANGKLWEVIDDGGTIGLARFGPGGFETGVELPGAIDSDGQWSVRLDRTGKAYAIGMATPASGNGKDLAVYAVSQAGVLLSSAGFNAGSNSQSLAWDSNGDLWITGFIQADNAQGLTMGLWRYSTANGTLSQTATFLGAGTAAAGFGVRALNNSVYVEGYTSTQPLSSPSLGLSLWRFDGQGHGPVAGPFVEPNYLTNLNTGVNAKLEAASGTLYAVGQRTGPGGENDLGFVRYDANGTILVDRYESVGTDAGASLMPQAVALDAQGNIAVAVQAGGQGNGGYGVARFGRDGSFLGATSSNHTNHTVYGMTALGSDLWLAVDASTFPVKFVGDQNIPVTDVLVSSGPVDLTPPVTALTVSGATVTLTAVDPAGGSVPPSGVAETLYWLEVDPFGCNADYDPSQPAGTCANPVYSAPFQLSQGTHTVSFQSTDAAGNFEDMNTSTLTIGIVLSAPPPSFQVAPATGPIGIPFTIAGTGFGTYAGGDTRVRFGAALAPLSVWNDTTISGTVPGLSTGTYAVAIERLTASTSAGAFQVLLPTATALSPPSGPIGIPFTIAGTAFGPYNGGSTRVRVGGVIAPLSVWNDAQIAGTLPNVSTGAQAVLIERLTADGGYAASTAGVMNVTAPSIASVAPSSGPIGAAFTLTGTSFGSYAGANTLALIGGATAQLSVWNDTTIGGTVPGVLAPGSYAVVVERLTADGGAVFSASATYQVVGLSVATITPSTGPIGIPFTIAGSGFGAYNGANTRVRIGGMLSPVSVWNDTAISGTIPGLSTGSFAVCVERQQGSSVSVSTVATFGVTAPVVSTMTPISAPIGQAFSIVGASFGPYAGAQTTLRIGGVLAPVSVWNDTAISGTIPNVSAGPQAVLIQRLTSDGGVMSATAAFVTVTVPAIASVTPGSGPIGAAFTLSGTSFGAYAGANTLALIGGATAQLSIWNDTTVSGTVPGDLSPGTYPVVVERLTPDGGAIFSATAAFQVVGLMAGSIAPSTGPVGIPFTITGTGFGAYNGSNTRVRVGGVLSPLSVWNDTTISGTIPGISSGTYAVCVERQQGSNVSVSTVTSFGVIAPNALTLLPGAGPIGVPFTVTGAGFGPYAGSLTRLLVGGSPASLSLWNDTTISGTIPGSAALGARAVVVERATADGYVVDGAALSFVVAAPGVASFSPSSAPIGAPFTITGSGFGPYAGGNTLVLIGGASAPLSVWNDTTISGTLPGTLAAGVQAVVARRTADGVNADTAVGTMTVVVPVVSTLTPSFGPTGTAFELDGAGFGPYSGSQTQVLVGGVAASLSVWNDAVIRGLIPDSLSNGTYTIVAVRSPSGGSVQSNPVTFTVGTGLGGAALGQAAVVVHPTWFYQAALIVGATEGAVVTAPSRAAVQVPARALAQDVSLTIDRAVIGTADQNARDNARGAASLGKAGDPIQYGPEGTRFATPVTITLPYDPTQIPLGKETQVAVHYWDPTAKAWQNLTSTVDAVRHLVSARTDHFSLYQALVPGVASLGTAGASNTVATAQIACNPLRPGCRPMSFQNLPASARLRIYTMSGALVRDLTADGNGQATWDGTNDRGGSVASGVYLIYAQGAGTSKTLKIAVEK